MSVQNLWNTDWMGKKVRFYRDEIEGIVKEENIDRNRFAEFSKFQIVLNALSL